MTQPPTALQVVGVASDEDLRAARDLFVEYQRAIGVDLSFQDFERELSSLPGEYAPPSGRLLLATVDGQIAGCVALRKFSEVACEMKRLYVRAAFEGRGVGRALASAIIEEAKAIGYRSMLLDTLPSMARAQSVYRALGFRAIAPYRFNPVPGTLFFELPLER